MALVRVGTCSWADRGLIEHWYPKEASSAEARLRYYAERFDCVEVNSSYYAIPDPAAVARWVDRTPDGFVFHVKAFGLMTGHRVTPEQLPPDLRGLVDRVTSRGQVEPSPLLRRRVFARFRAALEPLRAAGRMGGILMQFPPGLRPGDEAWAQIEDAQELLRGDELLVEFRQRDWLGEDRREETLGRLEALGLTYVVVDAPPVAAPNVCPTVIAATSGTAYVRFHGRNVATWNETAGRADARFDHRYAEDELREWVEPLRELARATRGAYAMFNTNNADQGPVNAGLLRRLLEAAGVPVAPPPGAAQRTLF